MIPDEAVEAAAKVLDFHLPDAAHERGCALRCGYAGDELAEHLAAHILVAAAPHLMAGAWDEGVGAEFQRVVVKRRRLGNPYRKAPTNE